MGVVWGEAEASHYMLLYRVSLVYLNEITPQANHLILSALFDLTIAFYAT